MGNETLRLEDSPAALWGDSLRTSLLRPPAKSKQGRVASCQHCTTGEPPGRLALHLFITPPSQDLSCLHSCTTPRTPQPWIMPTPGAHPGLRIHRNSERGLMLPAVSAAPQLHSRRLRKHRRPAQHSDPGPTDTYRTVAPTATAHVPCSRTNGDVSKHRPYARRRGAAYGNRTAFRAGSVHSRKQGGTGNCQRPRVCLLPWWGEGFTASAYVQTHLMYTVNKYVKGFVKITG